MGLGIRGGDGTDRSPPLGQCSLGMGLGCGKAEELRKRRGRRQSPGLCNRQEGGKEQRLGHPLFLGSPPQFLWVRTGWGWAAVPEMSPRLTSLPPPPDKTIIMWKLTRDETNYGIPQRALRGHSHFVSDVVISSDGQFALSGSWDGTLRLWDLTT